LRNTLKNQLEHFRNTYTSFDKGAIKIFTGESNELLFDIELKNYPIKDFVGIYSEISNTARTYRKLNHRNNKKSDKQLYKHAMHLIRLLITGNDLLNGKGIITKRKAERDLLMSIRNGEYSFDEIFKITDEYQKKFEEASATTILPHQPDMDKIERFLISLYF